MEYQSTEELLERLLKINENYLKDFANTKQALETGFMKARNSNSFDEGYQKEMIDYFEQKLKEISHVTEYIRDKIECR